MSILYNFSAGPSTLPLPVLEKASRELIDFEGCGISLIEMSHRGKIYDKIHNETINLAREILEIPENFHIIFIQGGATLQFGMIPLSFLNKGMTADYIVTGSWSKKAFNDGKAVGITNIAWDGEGCNYNKIPSQGEIQLTKNAAYVHLCSNETIGGIQWQSFPETDGVPLIIDMSSEIMSRPLPWEKIGMAYAGTQKNLAPAGMSLIIINKSLAQKARTDLPSYLRYDLHIDKNSLYNTPPTFVIWMTNLTLNWIKSIGGLSMIEKLRDEKAKLIYDIIDQSNGFYINSIEKKSRSKMNIIWRLSEEKLEKKFLEGVEQAGLDGLKGHRSVGGFRASIYNAMPVEGVKTLSDFMKKFMDKNG